MLMQKLSCFLLLALLVSTAGTAQTITQPKVWLRGDAGTVSSALWSDQSGHKMDAFAPGGGGPSDEGMLNFNRAMLFDGENDLMQVPYSLENLPELSMFTVFQSADTTERGVWAAEQTVDRKLLLTTRRAAGPDHAIDEYGKHENMPVLNTIVQNWNETLAMGENAYLALGTSGLEQDSIKAFKGLVAELIVYDRVLSFMERIQVQTYLAVKYGIPLKEGNYVSAAETVLWKAEENKAFSHRISGIGRDDVFGLYQKQSKSALDTTDLLLLSVGKPAVSNAENTARMSNDDFLLWGDNGQSLEVKAGEGENKVLSLLNRKWLMSVSGSAAQLGTQLQLKTSLLPEDSLGYWLVVDRSGLGDFSVDKLEYILADSVSSDSIAYYQLQWDTDGSGKDQFGFARAKHMLAVLSELQNPDCDSLSGGRAVIRIIGGEAPFTYELSSAEAGISRSWEAAADTAEQQSLKAGNYQLKVKGADRHEVKRTFALELPNTLLVNLGADQQLAEGNAIMLDAGEFIPDSIPATYQWESSYGFQSTEPRISITETGIYRVTVSNEEGCQFSDEIIIGGSVAQRFAVFPSPVKGGHEFSISVSLEEAGSVALRIYNLNGNLFQQLKGTNNSEYHFKGSLKDAGIYMVVLDTPKGTEARRIVVH